jgi:hypothetical protein
MLFALFTMFKDSADALRAGLTFGLCHGRVSPDMLVFNEHGHLSSVMLADIGVAQLVQSACVGDTPQSPLSSKELHVYGCKEAQMGALDSKCDVFALGMVVSEVIMGFVGTQDRPIDPQAMLTCGGGDRRLGVVEEAAARLALCGAPQFADILRQCCLTEHETRPDAAQLFEALTRVDVDAMYEGLAATALGNSEERILTIIRTKFGSVSVDVMGVVDAVQSSYADHAPLVAFAETLVNSGATELPLTKFVSLTLQHVGYAALFDTLGTAISADKVDRLRTQVRALLVSQQQR